MDLQKKLKTPAGVCFLASLVSGFITHLFALTNVIHNYDSVLRLPYDYGSGLPHGRWGLQFLGDMAQKLGGNTNLPLFNGLMFIFLVALSAALLIDLFSVRDRKQAALIGMVFAVFPTSVSVLIHRYAAVYYGISMLLAVLAVWVLGKCRLSSSGPWPASLCLLAFIRLLFPLPFPLLFC